MPKFKQECIFGLRAVIEAIQQGKNIDRVIFRQGNRGDLHQQLFQLVRERDIPYQFLPDDAFRPFAGRNHQGVLAEIAPIPYHDLLPLLDDTEAAGRVPLLLLLDHVTDVRNLGGIARTAECAGATAILIPNKNSAKISSDAIKTSAGALYHIPVCREKNPRRVIRELRHRGFSIVAATEKADTPYTSVDLRGPTLLILGAEDTGITPELLELATAQDSIPQFGHIASLNVSAAAAVLLYEAVRQRTLS